MSTAQPLPAPLPDPLADTSSQGELRLTPALALRWDGDPAWSAAFAADWRDALFTLAAEKSAAPQTLSVRYWRAFAEHHLIALCHIPAPFEPVATPPPSAEDLQRRAQSAPPIQGGEHLDEDALRTLWMQLDAWAESAAAAAGGLNALLAARAPQWRQVGRVCFRLAENRSDAARPFAFMATYATGFGAAGKLRHQPLRRALEQYAGAGDRDALVRLLAPVRRAAEVCPWVRALVDSGEVHQAVAWTPARAHQMLRSAPELEASGLSVQLPDWWRRRPRPRVSVTLDAGGASPLGSGALLGFDAGIALGDEALSADEIAALLSGADGLVLVKDQWVEVDRDKLREALAHWETLRRTCGGAVSFAEGMRMLAGAPLDLDDPDADAPDEEWVRVRPGEALSAMLATLHAPDALTPAVLDGVLQATLRPYQRTGVSWLRFLTSLGLGACLADDMGLGKTMQVLGVLLCAKQDPSARQGPSLLVAPASLMANWRSEAERFAPSLQLRFLHASGSDRQFLADVAADPERHLQGVDLAVTTYAMLPRLEWLQAFPWRLVILDEAQAIKNPGSRQSRAARRLRADARIAMTGTPVENRLGDLWSLFDFLNPGLLGTSHAFKTFVDALREREHRPFAPLRRLVAPYILRRLKTDRRVISDLPTKTETVRHCPLTRAQVRLYQTVVDDLRNLLENPDVSAMSRRGAVLRGLLRLKQVCNHPDQLTGAGDYRPSDSGKFRRLAEICEELAARQERVLVFTQFREIMAPLAEHLTAVFGRSGLMLHGAVPVARRRALVEQFQDADGPPFFLLSLKAGGAGLNLTAASHVVHFDRWWNPAVENQATDRTFRIGQTQPVLVHKFLVPGTIEERIERMLAEKRTLADDILTGAEVNLTELSDRALLDLVRLDVSQTAV